MAQGVQRIATLSIDGIDDVIVVDSLDAKMKLSESFVINTHFASTNADLTSEQIIGKSVNLTLTDNANDPQVLNGVVSALTIGELSTDYMREYRIVVVPWLEFLKHNRTIAASFRGRPYQRL